MIEPIKTDRKKSSGNYTTIVINLGSRHKITPAHLIAGIAESTGISGRDIGKIKISERSSTVDIPADRAKEIVEIVSKTQIGGRVPFVSIINKEKRDRPRSRRRKA